jgi:hypothetical protein
MGVYMEAISAMEITAARKPVKENKYVHIRPAVPPLTRPKMLTLLMGWESIFDLCMEL